ncbi:Crp/Fnr family transcriptional regulator [Pedobacter frigiditerrae]|uniref:Crp/Fnr family transcriptional regulator n=1 Tax=Pedobacter frigiditerrae TaxID=2530452 RepID=UPI00292D04D9|nr:Crp/Fnr family transcriptional regulator [Pedobacter frigiditerrae]
MDKLGYFNVFFDFIQKVNPMTEYDRQLCLEYFKVEKFEKNTIIEKAEKIHLYENFIVSGILRKYRLEETGIETTTAISNKPCFFSCFTSYTHREISDENLEAITDCILIRARREDIDLMLKKGKTLQNYALLVFQHMIDQQKQNALDLVNLTAKERYLKLLNQHPQLIQNVPLQFIASLLGVTPQSLSRIRKEITI